jgi:RND superfamily putative drug exporter
MRLSTESIARACARHPRRTIGIWVGVVVLALVLVGSLLSGKLTSDGAPTNTPDSKKAKDLIAKDFPQDARRVATDIIVVRSTRLVVSDAAFRRRVAGIVRDADRTGVVTNAASYLTVRSPALVSRDRHAAMIPIDVPTKDDISKVLPIVKNASGGEFGAFITGTDTVNHDFAQLSQDDLKSGELRFGIPASLIILLLVFGAVVAAFVPIGMALVAIVAALGLTTLVAQQFGLSVFVVNMLTGMGLALGIDYSLFIVSRYREERGRGLHKEDAIVRAGATASRAVLFSGTAFVVAMCGMLIVPSSIMQSLATGAILVGITSVLGALTLLPALLAVLGDRVNAGRIPFFGSRSIEETNSEGRFWRRIVEAVQRRPLVSLVAAVAVLLALASPVLGLHVGARGVASLPNRFASKQGFNVLQQEFPGATANPVRIVVADNASAPSTQRALASLRTQLAGDPRFGAGSIERSTVADAAVLTIPIRGDSASDSARSAVRGLRSQTIPALFANTDATVYVGGDTAESIDYVNSVSDPTPYVLALVLGLTLILLTIVFRSVVVAATSVLLNLLSVGAAYGLLVLVFQDSFASSLLGFTKASTIEAWVPLFLFSVLFGLSMDYQVFLLTRIRERYLQSGDTREAVAHGVASTARLITGAALIIVAVFLGFAMGDLIMFQQMGFGIAVALLIDATIIRSILVPAAMTLLGKWNWYLPQRLAWIPDMHVEGAASKGA